jgi:hypothetical protein
MTIRVTYEAVLEYEEDSELLPADPREEIRSLVHQEPGFGEVTIEEVVDEQPVNGSVVKTNWVDDGTMLAWVEDGDTTWCETYEFQTKEEVMD